MEHPPRRRHRAVLAMSAALLVAAGMVTVLNVESARALDNGVARTPPMGWNSWNTFGCNINESLIKQMV
ncbi:MAG: alpha-galactosidase, partial [Saccharothrix sp.]|nr:alpha-galactosidase [Saccharothrix sp.]